MINVRILTVPTKKNLAATSHLPFQPMYLVLMITCKWFSLNLSFPLPSKLNLDYSDLEDSHVIPALIHKCYLAKSEDYFGSCPI